MSCESRHHVILLLSYSSSSSPTLPTSFNANAPLLMQPFMPRKRAREPEPVPLEPGLGRRKRRCVHPAQRCQSVPPSVSLAPSTPLPLTPGNLQLLDEASPSEFGECIESSESSESSRPDEPSMAGDDEAANRKSIDSYTKLAAHGICICPANIHALPAELADFIKRIVRAERETTPSATTIAQKAPQASGLGEQAAIDLLCADLLFKGEGPAGGGGERLVQSLPKLNLNTAYLPDADSFAAKEAGPLSQAQPDTAIGYITSTQGERGAVEAPLDKDQEMTLARYARAKLMNACGQTCRR